MTKSVKRNTKNSIQESLVLQTVRSIRYLAALCKPRFIVLKVNRVRYQGMLRLTHAYETLCTYVHLHMKLPIAYRYEKT